jgi:hypothetical protein
MHAGRMRRQIFVRTHEYITQDFDGIPEKSSRKMLVG